MNAKKTLFVMEDGTKLVLRHGVWGREEDGSILVYMDNDGPIHLNGNRVPGVRCYETVHEIVVHMADDEWGTGLMLDLAKEILTDPEHAQYSPLICIVHEHAGWRLGFTMVDGEMLTVYSANDQATFSDKVNDLRKSFYYADWKTVKTIRRNDLKKPI